METHDEPQKNKLLCSQTSEERRWHPWLWWGHRIQGRTASNTRPTAWGWPSAATVWSSETHLRIYGESPLCHKVKLRCLRVLPPGWHQARKIRGRAWLCCCLLKDICCWGNVQERDSLAFKPVNQKVNMQDVALFSLKISTMTHFCPTVNNSIAQSAPTCSFDLKLNRHWFKMEDHLEESGKAHWAADSWSFHSHILV